MSEPMPPPFGVPAGPSYSTPDLLRAYLQGAVVGSSADAHIEEPTLLAHDHVVALRLDVAVLVRDDVPSVAEPVRALLYRALEDAGMTAVNDSGVLAGAVASELAAPRGFEWCMWARNPDTAQTELARRAVEGMVDPVALDAARQQTEAEMDAILRRLEEDL